MRVELVTPPEREPVSVDEAREFLRLTSREEDGLLLTLVTAARDQVERVTGRALAPQTRRLVLDRFPLARALPLPRAPLVAVERVEYVDAQNELRTLGPEAYDVVAATTPGAVCARSSWPSTADRPGVVAVTYRCGYGATEADGGVTEPLPEPLAVAVRQLVGLWYDDPTAALPPTFDFLTAGHRVRYRLPD